MTDICPNRDIKTRPGLASFLFVRILPLVLGGWAMLGLVACDSKPKEHVIAGSALGTTYHIKLVVSEDDNFLTGAGSEPVSIATLQTRIEAVIDKLDHSMSTYKPDSELNQLNRYSKGEAFQASAELLNVLGLVRRIHDTTRGAFDPTVGPLVDLWGFGPVDTGDRVPSDAEISALSQRVGFQHVLVDLQAGTVTKTVETAIDLSAIGKGYVVDRIADFLFELGAEDFLVEVGGELRLSGNNGSGQLWNIAVENPELAQGSIHSVVAISDKGVATSGDYRNYFEHDGVRYSHTIDPRNGYPIRHKLASVTVFAPTAAEADALATGFMVLGKDESLRIAEAIELPVFLLVKDAEGFKEYYTKAFAPYLSGRSND